MIIIKPRTNPGLYFFGAGLILPPDKLLQNGLK